jgi:transglutaminase-like putative cysteine protease
VPPVALVAFADSVLEDQLRPVFGLLFLVSATAMLFADGLRRVAGWGPVWSRPGRAARLDVTAGRGARRIAAAAVAVAAVAPIFLPGFGSRGVIDVTTTGDDSVRIDPLVSVQNSLQRDDVATVFEVEAEVGRYWRLVSLPNFDGSGWTPDPEPPSEEIEPGASLEVSARSVAVGEPAEVTLTTMSELAMPWLPLPYPPTSTDAQLEGMRWDPEGGSITLEQGVGQGVTYRATADVVQPTPAELRDETLAADAATVRYTQVPPDLPADIRQLALEWTRDAITPYDKVIAIQDRLTDTSVFSYDASVPASTSERAMVEFLTETRRGFCQQFSSTMAVMLRTLAIPARLAVGFTPGSFEGSADRLTVTTENAHSWVEVYFPSYGWLPFEPTPGRQNPVAYPYIAPGSDTTCDPESGECTPTRRGGAAGAGAAETAATSVGRREGLAPAGSLAAAGRDPTGAGDAGAAPDDRIVNGRRGLLALTAVTVVVLALVPLIRAWRRRRRLRAARSSPRALILATYDVFVDRAADLGHPKPPGQTLEEYRRALAASSSRLDGDLDRLTRLATDAAYAPREPERDDALEAARASRSVVQTMRRQAPWTQRLTGPYRPR